MERDCVVVVAGAPIKDTRWLKQTLDSHPNAYRIGVDRGALKLSRLGFHLDEAVGDFDSVSEEEFCLIKQSTHQLTQLPREKDLTDLDEALLHITSNPSLNNKPVYIYGALGSGGGRLDHLLHNISLFSRELFKPLLSRVHLIEKDQEVLVFKPGFHLIKEAPRWQYFGVFTLNSVKQLTIQQAKYTLEPTDTKGFTSWISNEFIPHQDALIQFESGIVFVVLTALT
ncbi:thiamine diphosphokinase [Dolosicoccus paucivorans]|uniref:Thiamine diphosphokinase n=1 Tax=Dolosicoccus paucivorans TaxID=84521 RepID=A0A2N6SMW8_9LACT|nr:thiamine diphosphokinase [Dolosicoccus paucivorans]PMB84481.1 thiamine diphosphokinase [Dolosicoccus paucivorans]PMC58399.1 thiamine diphosphokinase [Dolosicoccus paucivorans]